MSLIMLTQAKTTGLMVLNLTLRQQKIGLGFLAAVIVGVSIWFFFFRESVAGVMDAIMGTNVILPSGERAPDQDPNDGTPVGDCPPFGFDRDPYTSAANQAGLDASLLSFCNSAWYYNNTYTCISGDPLGSSNFNADVCPDSGVICAPELLPQDSTCAESSTFRSDGSLNCKMKAIASVINNGMDASCALMASV